MLHPFRNPLSAKFIDTFSKTLKKNTGSGAFFFLCLKSIPYTIYFEVKSKIGIQLYFFLQMVNQLFPIIC